MDRFERIQKRAYEFWELRKRMGVESTSLDNWLDAETEDEIIEMKNAEVKDERVA